MRHARRVRGFHGNEKAIYWLEFAESLLDGESAYKLGVAYRDGRLGLEQDTDAAVDHLEKSISYGFQGAYYPLSELYFNSKIRQKQARARRLLEAGAEAGSADCQFKLASRILCGQDQVRDDKVALTWLTQAVEQGHGEALIKFGELHLIGAHVEKSAYMAFSYIERAARGHSGLAQSQLSSMYLHGVGVERSLTLGYAWLCIAERNRFKNSPVAAEFTGKVLVHQLLSDVQMKHAQAFVQEFTSSRSWTYGK